MKKKNPLPCGCAIVGIQHIDSMSGMIYYTDHEIKYCPMHKLAPKMLQSVIELSDRLSNHYDERKRFNSLPEIKRALRIIRLSKQRSE